MTSVINIKNAPPGWKTDDQFVYIGRGSVWGNPFRMGDIHPVAKRPMTRDDVCDLYLHHALPNVRAMLHLIKGKTLVCFCHPSRCHGHLLAKAADET